MPTITYEGVITAVVHFTGSIEEPDTITVSFPELGASVPITGGCETALRVLTEDDDTAMEVACRIISPAYCALHPDPGLDGLLAQVVGFPVPLKTGAMFKEAKAGYMQFALPKTTEFSGFSEHIHPTPTPDEVFSPAEMEIARKHLAAGIGEYSQYYLNETTANITIH